MPGVPTTLREEGCNDKTSAAIEFAHQAERLGLYTHEQEKEVDAQTQSTQAVAAHFVTAQDPVIETANGGRLPAVPVEEARKLNYHKDVLHGKDPKSATPVKSAYREARDGTLHGAKPLERPTSQQSGNPDAPLGESTPPWKTNPLFPPLPMYGPPTFMRNAQCWLFRISSSILSLCFLAVVCLGAVFTSIPTLVRRVAMWMVLRNLDKKRPFFDEELRRSKARAAAEQEWKRRDLQEQRPPINNEKDASEDEYIPTEGGPDRLMCDAGYYARRVGLDCEIFEVQTEDGFIIELWHIYNPKEKQKAARSQRAPHDPSIFTEPSSIKGLEHGSPEQPTDRRYPVLLIHGLLQSAGAYCVNDDDSLAFYLAKSGYDVWLGNNRCGFRPKHTMLQYSDPRMWAWNIRQMGVMDLPALISRVLSETGFPKCALVGHSQGTTESLVALAKEQRPEIGEKISVFCALAPAAYSGRLIGKFYFKFMRIISPAMFRVIFGIHSFIPFMMIMHRLLPPKFYGKMGYMVFSFLFDWSDERWDRGLNARAFQFSPVYISAESMRWWLGRECFAKQKCILATREEKNIEDREDAEEDERMKRYYDQNHGQSQQHISGQVGDSSDLSDDEGPDQPKFAQSKEDRAKYAWYAPPVPPMAFWVCGNDALVDGRRLLRRFERGREPHVRVVHSKVIEGYEHLDVLWAIDAIEKVGSEVKEVIWKTVPPGTGGRAWCRTPKGCETVEVWEEPKDEQTDVPIDIDAAAGINSAGVEKEEKPTKA